MLPLTITDITVSGESKYPILKIPSFSASAGERIGVCGPSGAGKSTFLYLISGLVGSDSGSIFWGDTDISILSEWERDRFRREKFGFIFQDSFLFEELSALENAAIEASFSPRKQRKDITDRAAKYLKKLHIPVGERKVELFSGGERQRVAVARALAGSPHVILADEPTASLDRQNRQILLDDLIAVSQQKNKTLIMVSHDQDALQKMDRIIEIRDGNIFSDSMETTDKEKQS